MSCHLVENFWKEKEKWSINLQFTATQYATNFEIKQKSFYSIWIEWIIIIFMFLFSEDRIQKTIKNFEKYGNFNEYE